MKLKAIIYSALLLTVILRRHGDCLLGPDSKGPKFIAEPPAVVQFSNEEGTLLVCSAEGSPQPAISWYLTDGTLITSIPNIREINLSGNLYFPRFGAENYRHDIHSAGYRCEASNEFGKIRSRDISVQAVVRQHYDVYIPDTYVYEGNMATLRCEAPVFVKEFISVTSWIQDNSYNIYPSVSSDSKHHMLPTGELIIYSVTKTDSLSKFRCRTVHKVTGATVESSGGGNIIITESHGEVPLRRVDRATSPPVRSGDTAVLTCSFQGIPPPTIYWYRGTKMGSDEMFPSDRVHIRDGVITIQNAQVDDSGSYTCAANNSVLHSVKYEVHLLVHSAITIHLTPQQVTVDTGKDTELSCEVSGHPLPTIHWMKDGVAIRNSGHIARPQGNQNERLIIKNVMREDRGMYQCFAKNAYETAQATSELRLGDSAPQLAYKFIEQTMRPGPSVSLKCIATGNPTPQITWALDGFPISPNDRLMIGQYVTLHGDVVSHSNISSVQVEDGGEYRCSAANRVGVVGHSARLNIYGVPMVRAMNTIAAVAGRDLVVQCPVSGYPVSSITWSKDGNVLPTNRRQDVFENGTLILRKIDHVSDRGTYTCSAKNKDGLGNSQSVGIEVKVPPKLEKFSFPSDIYEGARVMITCAIRSGDSPLKLQWFFNGSQNLPEGAATFSHGDDALSLRISSAGTRHTGNYSCVAGNSAATDSHQSQLVVHVPPRIAPFSFNKELSEGMRAQVSCGVEKGDPPFTITWLRDRQPLSPEGLRIYGLDTHSSTVVVDRLTSNHAGNYTCLVKNEVATDEYTAELVVSVPPYWSHAPTDQQVPVDTKNYRMDCQADGNPSPTITWRKNYGSQAGLYRELAHQDHGTGIRVFPNGTLIFEKLKKEHEGFYLCEAGNGVGTVLSQRIFLTVHAPAAFQEKNRNYTARLGYTASLRCEAQGDPPLKILWRKNGATLDSLSYEYRVSHKEVNRTGGVLSDLFIKRTVRLDGGRYYCLASNPFGKDQMAIDLLLTEPPDFPRGIQVMAKGSRFVTLAWVLAQDGNSPIIHYIAEYKPESATWNELVGQQIIPAGQLMANITDLMPAMTYNFRLFAENELGKSLYSDILEVITDGEKPSGPPRNIKVTPTTSTSLLVRWEPPEPDLMHGDIISYTINFKEKRQGNQQTNYHSAEGRLREFEILGLKKFTPYGIRVQAYNALGEGPASTEVLATTLEDVPSAPPQDVRCSSQNSQSIETTWTPVPEAQLNGILKVPPSPPLLLVTRTASSSLHLEWSRGDDGGAPITGFQLDYKKENEDWHTVPIDPKSCSFVLKDLDCGTKYLMRMAATNTIGTGEKSALVTASTDGAKPLSMAAESFIHSDRTSATLFLENWHDNGCPIQRFEVAYRKFDDPGWIHLSSDVEKQRHIVLRSLSPKTLYFLRVRAVNAAGSTQTDYKFLTLKKSDSAAPTLTQLGDEVRRGQKPFNKEELFIVLVGFFSSALVIAVIVGIVWYCCAFRNFECPSSCNPCPDMAEEPSEAAENEEDSSDSEDLPRRARNPISTPSRTMQTRGRLQETCFDVHPYSTVNIESTTRINMSRYATGVSDRDEMEQGTSLRTFRRTLSPDVARFLQEEPSRPLITPKIVVHKPRQNDQVERPRRSEKVLPQKGHLSLGPSLAKKGARRGGNMSLGASPAASPAASPGASPAASPTASPTASPATSPMRAQSRSLGRARSPSEVEEFYNMRRLPCFRSQNFQTK